MCNTHHVSHPTHAKPLVMKMKPILVTDNRTVLALCLNRSISIPTGPILTSTRMNNQHQHTSSQAASRPSAYSHSSSIHKHAPRGLKGGESNQHPPGQHPIPSVPFFSFPLITHSIAHTQRPRRHRLQRPSHTTPPSGCTPRRSQHAGWRVRAATGGCSGGYVVDRVGIPG